MRIADISAIVKPCAEHVSLPEGEIRHLLTDSRRLVEPQGTLFFDVCRIIKAKRPEELIGMFARIADSEH